MKTKGRRQSTNIQDRRNKRVEPSIVGQAKRNADAVQWMKSRGEVPDKVKKDMGNALTSIRRNSAVKQTRDRYPQQMMESVRKHMNSKKKQDRLK